MSLLEHDLADAIAGLKPGKAREEFLAQILESYPGQSVWLVARHPYSGDYWDKPIPLPPQAKFTFWHGCSRTLRVTVEHSCGSTAEAPIVIATHAETRVEIPIGVPKNVHGFFIGIYRSSEEACVGFRTLPDRCCSSC